MAESRPNTQYPLGRSDESVEWALSELERTVEGCPEESRARAALDVLRRSFNTVQVSAATDPLTGLANRTWFHRVLDERLRPEVTACGKAAVLFLEFGLPSL